MQIRQVVMRERCGCSSAQFAKAWRFVLLGLALVSIPLTFGIAAWAAGGGPPTQSSSRSEDNPAAQSQSPERTSRLPREVPVPRPADYLMGPVQHGPPVKITHGRFTSVQVNVYRSGPGPNDVYNVLGDAANEPSIAVNLNNIVIGWREFKNVGNPFRQAGIAFSDDGGASWKNPTIGDTESPSVALGHPAVLDEDDFRSDPVLAADKDGNFYYSSLCVLPNVPTPANDCAPPIQSMSHS